MLRHVLLGVIFVHSVASSAYFIPDPVVQVFRLKGFKIVVPNEDDIVLVEFNINVNKAFVGLSEGKFSYCAKRAMNGAWVYENQCVKLSKGDVLYYWVYVQKGRLGYTRHGFRFLVTEFSNEEDSGEDSSNESISTTTAPPPCIAAPSHASNDDVLQCNVYVRNVTQSLLDLEQKLKSAEEENEILRRIAGAAEHEHQLTLSGIITETGEPLETVNFVLEEKLDVRPHVKKAWRSGVAVVTFEVYTLDEKLEIIKKAKKKLQHSKQLRINY